MIQNGNNYIHETTIWQSNCFTGYYLGKQLVHPTPENMSVRHRFIITHGPVNLPVHKQ